MHMISFTQWLNGLLYQNELFDALVYICAQYMIFIIVAAFVAIFALYYGLNIWQGVKGLAVATVLWGITQLLNVLTAVERPFVSMTDSINPLFVHGLNDSFPSGHSVVMFALAFFVYRQSRSVGLLMLVLSLASGVSRIIAGVHWPTDIAASIVIAYIGVSSFHYIYDKFISKK